MFDRSVKSTLSLPNAIELFDAAINSGHSDRHKRTAERLGDRLGRLEKYRNHFTAATVNGLTVLNFAAKFGHVLLAEILLGKLSVDPNNTQYDDAARTTLHYAVHSGSLELVTKLVTQYFADTSARDVHGSTPLHLAVFAGKSDIAAKLIEYGANVELENHCGRAMHAAALNGNLSIVTAIAAKEPFEVNATVSAFITPFMCAMYGAEPECESWLIQTCSLDGGKLFYKVVSFKDNEADALESVKILLQREADPNIFEESLYEDLAIISAAKKGWSNVISLLLARTNQIPDVDWTEAGLINYVNTDVFRQMDAARIHDRVSYMKSRVLEELAGSNALTALILWNSVKPDMEFIEWGYWSNLCRFMLFMWFEGCPVTCNHESIYKWTHILASSKDPMKRNWALPGVEACLALSPNNPKYMTFLGQLTGHHGAPGN